MTRRTVVDLARVRLTSATVPDSTVIHAEVTGGTAAVLGRTGRLYMTDAEVREFLAELALRPRWAVAIEAASHDVNVQQAARGTQYMNAGVRRQVLVGTMEQAQQRQAEADLTG